MYFNIYMLQVPELLESCRGYLQQPSEHLIGGTWTSKQLLRGGSVPCHLVPRLFTGLLIKEGCFPSHSS